jgi:hypothetical protein
MSKPAIPSVVMLKNSIDAPLMNIDDAMLILVKILHKAGKDRRAKRETCAAEKVAISKIKTPV